MLKRGEQLDVGITFAVAGAVILLGFLGEWIFEKTSIPDPIWLMLFGIILNHFYSISSSPVLIEVGSVFAVFAMIFLLFEGVMNSDLKSLFLGFMRGSGLAVIHFVVTVIIITAAMKSFGWGWPESIILGIILSDAAQTVIIPLTKKIKIGKDSAAALTFEAAISDVLCIVGAITVVNIVQLNSFSLTEISKSLLYTFTIGLLLGVAVGFMWIAAHKRMNRFNKSYIITIGVLVLLYSFAEHMGANGALACLAFGIVLANSREIFAFMHKDEEEPSQTEKFFYAEISFFVQSFFFVYLGIMLNLSEMYLIFLGLFLTIIIIFARPLSVKLSGLSKKLSEKDRIFVEVLNPKGTSAAVLAQFPLQYGIVHAREISTIVPAVITFSILLCVIAVYLTTKGYFHGYGNVLMLRKYFHK